RQGALLVTASEEGGTVEFWDPARLGGGERIPSLPPGVRDVALSPDGLAVSSHPDQVCLLDLANRQIERTLPLPAGVHGVAFAPDGRIVAAACADHQTRLWDVASGRQVLTLDHGAVMQAVAFSPTGGLAATAGWDGKVRLWNFPSGTLRTICAPHRGGRSTCMAFAADGRSLGVGGTGHTITVSLWDPSTGARPGELTDTGPMFTRRWSPAKALPTGEHALA